MANKRILIIDDEPDATFGIKSVLEEEGYEVYSAPDGKEGLKTLRNVHPDLVLLDLMLPDQSGFKIAQAIKSSQGHKETPIIAISFKKDAVDKHIAAKSGVVDYIEKPIDPDTLLFHIRDILGNAQRSV